MWTYLIPFVTGQKEGPPHSRLCWIYNDHKEWLTPGRDTNLAWPLGAIRTGGWKLVMQGGDPPELYVLASDPGEARNMAADYPEITEWAARLPSLEGGNETLGDSRRSPASWKVQEDEAGAVSGGSGTVAIRYGWE